MVQQQSKKQSKAKESKVTKTMAKNMWEGDLQSQTSSSRDRQYWEKKTQRVHFYT